MLPEHDGDYQVGPKDTVGFNPKLQEDTITIQQCPKSS